MTFKKGSSPRKRPDPSLPKKPVGRPRKYIHPDDPPDSGPGSPRAEMVVDGLLKGQTMTKSLREAGYSETTANMGLANRGTREWIGAQVRARQEKARELAGIHCDEIIGFLADIALHSIGDICDEHNVPSMEVARERKLDHLIEVFEEYETQYGTRRKFKMYSRMDAIAQLRDTFGIKMEPRANDFDAAKQWEVERALNAIMLADKVDKTTAARQLMEALGPESDLTPFVSPHVM